MSALGDWLGRIFRPQEGGPEIPGAPARQAPPDPAARPPQIPVGAVGEPPPPSAPVVRVVAGLPAPGELVALARLTDEDRRAVLLRRVVDPSLAWLEDLSGGRIRPSLEARRMLLTITGQEAAARERRQIPVAHAMGLWQFEAGGGVAGVLRHPSTARLAALVCQARGVDATRGAVHPRLAEDDVLACAFARLLLWTDPRPLPSLEGAGWETYLGNWRPGAYTNGDALERAKLRSKWGGNWRQAEQALRA